jgi:hypothetical protein
MPSTVVLEPYEGTWPAADADASFRSLVAEYSRLDPMPTLETLSRHTDIPVGALARFVLARYCTSGSDALLEIGPRVVRQMEEIIRQAEAAGSDAARLDAYRALKAVVSWLVVPLDDPNWRTGGR